MSELEYPSISADLPPYKIHTILLPSPVPNEPPTPIATLLPPSLSSSLPIPPHSTPYPHDPSYTILPTPTKGFGMFATRFIKAGELILNEHPVLIVPECPLPHDTRAWEDLGASLPEREKMEMLSMANCRSREECPSMVEGIVRTNALLFDLTPQAKSHQHQQQHFGGVFLKINRCNHSCGPNAAHKWDLSNLSSKLYALRTIQPGEEITIFYTDVTQPRSIRRAALERNHRFLCTCPHCSPPSSPSSTDDDDTEMLIRESDNTRLQLRTWLSTHPSYLKWSTDLCRPDSTVTSSHLHALALLSQENLHFLQCIFIEELVLSYAILGDHQQFEFWAKEFIEKCKVEDEARAREFEGWLEDRGRCRRWAWRAKQRNMARKRGPSPVYEYAILMDTPTA